MDVTVLPSAIEVGETIARTIVAGIVAAREHGRNYVLGCPAGRSGKPTYQALSRQVARQGVPLSHLYIISMDAYVVRSATGFAHLGRDDHASCERFVAEEIVQPLDRAAPGGSGIAETRVWLPDPRRPEEYDRRLADIGGIDFFLLASGTSDGHIGFNPPQSARDSRTRVVSLADSTRAEKATAFRVVTSSDRYRPEWPASIITECRRGAVYADSAAAG